MPKKAKRKTTTRGKAKKRTTARRKTTAKRATTRKRTARKATTRRKTTAKRAKRTTARSKKTVTKKAAATPIKSAYSKSQLLGEIADQVGLKKTDIKEVFETLNNIIHRHMRKGGAGEFNMPGLLKCRRVHKKATKARKGINPFTGEETMFKAKPARSVVKVRPLKGLKEMVS